MGIDTNGAFYHFNNQLKYQDMIARGITSAPNPRFVPRPPQPGRINHTPSVRTADLLEQTRRVESTWIMNAGRRVAP